ncbi:hypothetical protein Gotur_016023 [Gossypium turneri]
MSLGKPDEPNQLPETSSTHRFLIYNSEDEELGNDVMQSSKNESQRQSLEIDIKALEIDIKEMIKSERPPFPCCIYRVSAVLRDVNKKAYTPRTVSIGPLHHNNKNLKGMQAVKFQYLEQFLKRATKTAMLNKLPPWGDPTGFVLSLDTDLQKEEHFSCLERFLGLLKSTEGDIWNSYAEDDLNHITHEELLKIILVDSAFIIELFLRFHFNPSRLTPFEIASIRMDLLLIENQVPFFVLENLYKEAFGSYPTIYPTILELSCEFFEPYNDQKMKIQTMKHFTDLLRTFHLPIAKDGEHGSDGGTPENESKNREPDDSNEHLKSATQLYAAGVQFNISSSKCTLDISFIKPKLEIPCLHIYDDTEVIFRNVMVLEMYHYPNETLICDYVLLMDYLINTSEDAELLVEKKIITSRLGSNQQVASLFNRLGRNIVKGINDKKLKGLVQALNAYYDTPWHTTKATFWLKYFSTPWKAASTTAASLLLLLTLIQTVLTGIAL